MRATTKKKPIDIPIYCRDCHNQNNWVRQPDKDWITESGKIFEECWQCKVCGATTLRPPQK